MTPERILLWAHIAMVAVWGAWAAAVGYWARSLIRKGYIRSPRAWWSARRRGGE